MSIWNPPGGATVVLNSVEQIQHPGGQNVVVNRLHIDVVETDPAAAATDLASLQGTYQGGAVTISVTSPASQQPQDDNP